MTLRPLAIFTRYGGLGASSRLRFFAYRQILEAGGWLPEYHTFFPDAYLRRLYAGRGKSPASLAGGWFRRAKELRRLAADVPLLIEYELLPYLPYAAEARFLRRHPYILNFDDAVDLRYQHIPFLRGKYEKLLRGAAGVIVANDELAERFAPFQPRIIKLPTVPPDSVPTPDLKKFEKLTLCWIGTPVTYAYLAAHADTLRAMRQVADFDLLVIASEKLPPLPGVPTRCINWSADTEAICLRRSHIGIMPLPDTPFARGKSAYKLIQYLAAGIPAIASPVGENRLVLRDGITGFLASEPGEWCDALKKLLPETVRDAMVPGIAAAAAEYSLTGTGEKLLHFLTESF